jgi:hypothetical protein
MLSGVIRDREQLKVFKSIVGLDAVPVVDVLITSKAPAKVRFHNETMLQVVSAGGVGASDPDVAAPEVVPASAPVRIPLATQSPGGVATRARAEPGFASLDP